ncbi:MAG TPA: hypothetical protein VF510_21480 [Ktedonobacterales bacterium]
MSHIFEITDEEYQVIVEAAKARRTTPDVLFAQFVEGLRDPLKQPRYHQLDDWFRHLEDFEDGEQNIQGEDNADA